MTPAEFFALALAGGTMNDAHYQAGIAYSTVHRAKRGETISVDTAAKLDAWSRTVAEAAKAGAWIDAGRTLGIGSAVVKGAA